MFKKIYESNSIRCNDSVSFSVNCNRVKMISRIIGTSIVNNGEFSTNDTVFEIEVTGKKHRKRSSRWFLKLEAFLGNTY